MEPPVRVVPMLPPPRRSDGMDGVRATRRRNGGGQRAYRDEPFDVQGPGGGGYADIERFDPFYEPGLGMRAGGRILFTAQREGQEAGKGLHWEPHGMATSAYAQTAMLTDWY